MKLKTLKKAIAIYAISSLMNLSLMADVPKPLMVPNPDEIKTDNKAQEELLGILQEFEKKSKLLGEDESDTTKQWKEFDEKRLRELRQFLSKYPKSRSSLTAILAYADVAIDHPEEHSSVLEAFDKLRSKHLESWQAQFAGFIESNLMYAPGRRKSEKERTMDASKTLMAALPQKEPSISWNDPEFTAFRKFEKWKINPPFRAEYLNAIAGYEENLALAESEESRPTSDERKKWYQKAKNTYAQVIQEYPNSEPAKEASKRIDALELLIKSELIMKTPELEKDALRRREENRRQREANVNKTIEELERKELEEDLKAEEAEKKAKAN